MTMPDLLVIENDADDPLGHLEPAFRDLGLTWNTVKAWDGERVPSTVAGYAGLVVLGGSQAAYLPEQWPWLPRVESLMREAHATRVPVLAICLGAQLLAQALGGRAKPGDGVELGYQRVEPTLEGATDPLVRGAIPDDGIVLQLHGDTYDLPPGAVRLATGARYPEQAFRVGDRTYGLQFHPEMTVERLARTLPTDPDFAGTDIDPNAVVEQARAREAVAVEACRALTAAWFSCGCFD